MQRLGLKYIKIRIERLVAHMLIFLCNSKNKLQAQGLQQTLSLEEEVLRQGSSQGSSPVYSRLVINSLML